MKYQFTIDINEASYKHNIIHITEYLFTIAEIR
jgi:hypothetical protein